MYCLFLAVAGVELPGSSVDEGQIFTEDFLCCTLALKPDPHACFIKLHDITSHNTAWNIKPTERTSYCVCEKIVAPQNLVHPS